MLETTQPAKRGRKPSPQFGTEGSKTTLSMKTANLDWLKALAEKHGTHYSWVLDDMVTALRTGDQELMDKVLAPLG